MTTQICSLTLRAEQSQERQAGHDRHEKMQNKARRFNGETHGAEHTDDAEYRCGKANEHMS